MHLSLSRPQFDSLNKNCMKITSEGVNSSLSFKILKYSLAEVAVFINGGKSLSLSLHESEKCKTENMYDKCNRYTIHFSCFVVVTTSSLISEDEVK